jgi:hypothetical protein
VRLVVGDGVTREQNAACWTLGRPVGAVGDVVWQKVATTRVTTGVRTLHQHQLTLFAVCLQVPELPLPAAATLVSRAVHVEREHLTLGKVVLEELMNAHCCVVYWTPRTSFPESPENTGRAEPMSTRCLHRLPLG